MSDEPILPRARVPRASAVKAAEYIQTKVAQDVAANPSTGGTTTLTTGTSTGTGALTHVTTVAHTTTTSQVIKVETVRVPTTNGNGNANGSAVSSSVTSPHLPRKPAMPPPSDDEMMDGPGEQSGGSSEEEMDQDEANEEEDDGPSRPVSGQPYADRDDNTLTVEELKIKYGYGGGDSGTSATKVEDDDDDDDRAARRAARKEKKRIRKEKRRAEKERKRLEGIDENGGEEESSDEDEANDEHHHDHHTHATGVDEDDDDDEDDGDFAMDEDSDTPDGVDVMMFQQQKTSRVGSRYQSDLPALLTQEEQAAERSMYNANPSRLEGAPHKFVYVPPIETPEAHAARMNELAEKQRMQRIFAEEREARHRAAEAERQEQLQREARERRKKEQLRARRAEEEAEEERARKRRKEHHHEHELAPAGAAQLPDDLPPALLHGHILQSFPSSQPAPSHAAGASSSHAAHPTSVHGPKRFQAHYVSLFCDESQTKLVGIAFDRTEVEEALRGGGKTFRAFLQEKLGVA